MLEDIGLKKFKAIDNLSRFNYNHSDLNPLHPIFDDTFLFLLLKLYLVPLHLMLIRYTFFNSVIR